ncbi:MAG: LemA family protein [Nitrospirota bacterium]|nr:LemA family protein [Nitrospirota bacterium]
MTIWLLIPATIVVGFVWGVTVYLKLDRLQAARELALARLSAALHDRQELTLELMRVSSGYMPLEKSLIEAVALSRSYAMQARTVLARTKTETDLCWALARLLLAAQEHEDLLRDPRFDTLLSQLGTAENIATQGRNDYNRRVEDLEDFLNGPALRPFTHLLHLVAGQPFELDPKVAREAMMAMLTPRATAGTEVMTRRQLPHIASVAFNV